MTDIEYLKKYLPKDKLEEGLDKLKKGIPVQYIVGNVDFCGNIIEVNEEVLIPRFETELLTKKTIDYIKKYFDNPDIIDLGTGTGAIAITLKKSLNCNVDAVDISLKALKTAEKNAINNNVNINFYQSDMLEAIDKKYDVIISNPPYIAYDEEIEDIVKNNEPHIALFADNEGLEFYKKILSKASNHIKQKALIAFEIGENQALKIKEIAHNYLPQAKVYIEKDFTERDRFIFIYVNLL